MPYLYIFEFWYVTRCSPAVKIGKQSSKHLTHHIPPHTTSYTFSTYRRLLMWSEVLKVELLTLQTYFMTIDIWKKKLLISKNKEAYLHQSVCM